MGHPSHARPAPARQPSGCRGRNSGQSRGAGFTEPLLRCLRGMMSYTQDGALVLADISGFTAFVTGTELEHGPPIIAALLEEVMRQISPPLEIQEIEGDAVFALGLHGTVVPPSALFGVLRAGLAGFRDLQREMQ